MTYSDEFFTPEEVDRQIERVSQRKEGEPLDTEALAYLRSFYRQDSRQEQEALNRIWGRIAHATPTLHKKEKGKVIPMHDSQLTYNGALPRKSHTVLQRLGTLVAVLFVVAWSVAWRLYSTLPVIITRRMEVVARAAAAVQIVNPTPTPAPVAPSGQIGKIVYSTKVSMMDGMDAVWIELVASQ